ncbi:hypothetical protein [Gimesia aquarii]|uniref:Uncharacterized protein n=1 Tax=Gimesia aquarii TaxID=2527964 RepID=A0A517X199_9PLAN|nr:hypothetical protein [Gimesia aquarii]QDU11287.1 hypothetical protein V202x_47060 [Gimesia aquarii]
MSTSTRSNIAIAILWIAILLATGYYIVEGLKVIAEPVSKIIVAVLTGLFALIGVYFTHVLTTLREREADQVRRKQERYAAILEGLVPYIRSDGDKADEFAVPVLHAYVVGERRVASAIARFLEDRTSKKLDTIVSSMRVDLGMEPLDPDTSTEGLLAPKIIETAGLK